MDTKELMAEAQAIAQAAKLGLISYDRAKSKVEPFLKIINMHGAYIAQKYHIRYKRITFTSLIR